MNLDEAVIIALGSNLAGDYASPDALLEAALGRFGEFGLTVVLRSRIWRSAAWPDSTAPDYRNAVTIVETALSPQALLDQLHAIEALFGRVRSVANAVRTLDLDLIAHGRTVLDGPGLVLPHPRAAQRRFVMGPLAQIAPEWRHPVLGERAEVLAALASVGRDATPVG